MRKEASPESCEADTDKERNLISLNFPSSNTAIKRLLEPGNFGNGFSGPF